MCSYISIVRIICFSCCGTAVVLSSNNLDLQCRDNDNRPVDWWYMYKPPAKLFPDGSGMNFTYITSEISGQWVPSDRYINKHSMMVNTLMPMYKRSYENLMVVVVYQSRTDNLKSAARGVLMADEMGGFLLTHTVPEFPDLGNTAPVFPLEEAANGHLMTCVSLDLHGANAVAQALHFVSPNFAYVKLPEKLTEFFPLLQYFSNTNKLSNNAKSLKKPMTVDVKLNSGTKVKVAARPSGSTINLYRSFAEQHLLHLNVYGQSSSDYLTTVCSPTFGVRNIDTISIKYRDEVYYVTNYTDRSWFAVSTAASWQQTAPGPPQYWTCTSNLDKEDRTGQAGLLLCLEDYNIWRTFDNLKVREPACRM